MSQITANLPRLSSPPPARISFPDLERPTQRDIDAARATFATVQHAAEVLAVMDDTDYRNSRNRRAIAAAFEISADELDKLRADVIERNRAELERQQAFEAEHGLNGHQGDAAAAGGIDTHPSEEEAPTAFEWPELQPLVSETNAAPYPLDALPGGIGAAVREVVGFVQCPPALAACSALSVLSVVGQQLVDVQRSEKLRGPASLFLLAIADSGERKSTVDSLFSSTLRAWDEQQAEAAKPDLARHAAASAAWEAKRDGVIAAIRAAKTKARPTEALERDLESLEAEKPTAPRVSRLLYGDTTPEALAWNLAQGWPAGGVLSSEAGIVFGSHAMGRDSVMRSLSLLNTLWDGLSTRVDRRSSESFMLADARLTMGLAVQPETVKQFFEASRGLARGTGFAARFLIAWPESTQGQRFYREAPEHWPALSAFHRRIGALLDTPVPLDERGRLMPAVLTLSPAARAEWVAFHDDIERELGPCGEFTEARDVASKAADNAARLAALFHLFGSSGSSSIGADDMQAAGAVVGWHLFEARRFLSELAVPETIKDAVRLDAWLIQRCRDTDYESVTRKEVQRLGPSALRDGKALDAALAELIEAGRVRVYREGRQKRVGINPQLLEIDHVAS